MDDDSSDDELIVSDSREAFEVDKEIMQKEGVDANSHPVQNSAKVVQGVSFASLLRGKKEEKMSKELTKTRSLQLIVMMLNQP